MTDVPDPGALAEAARRHAIALVRARLDEIAEQTERREAAADPPSARKATPGKT